MINSPPPAGLPSASAQPTESLAAWSFDDDLAIGCECANPALQIERWGQESSAQPLQDFS